MERLVETATLYHFVPIFFSFHFHMMNIHTMPSEHNRLDIWYVGNSITIVFVGLFEDTYSLCSSICVPYISANIYWKLRNLPNIYTHNYSTDLR